MAPEEENRALIKKTLEFQLGKEETGWKILAPRELLKKVKENVRFEERGRKHPKGKNQEKSGCWCLDEKAQKRPQGIRDKDEVATQEEVEKAVKQRVGLSSLRPGYIGTQNITLKIEKVACNRLGKMIKIGLTNCRIEERVEVERWYRCWGLGTAPTSVLGGEKE
ncbi:hypothetical protein JTB14_008934 [Gonioctena quinquepunctata]|nr:hypothetical protein JTB14_008934 [Gonioctena quinquepunctata]